VRREATVVFRGLPVDGLKTILELGRGTELPLADNGPNDGTATDRCSEYDENCYSCVRETRATNLGIARRIGSRSAGDVAGQGN